MSKRVTTRVVIDIATGRVLERDSYLYDGPWALATNVTWSFTVTWEGAFLGRHDITTVTPTLSGIDFNSVAPCAFLAHPTTLLVPGGRSRAETLQPVRQLVSKAGTTHIVGEAAGIMNSYFAPAQWELPQTFTEEEPAAPPVVTGWGPLLGQRRNRIVQGAEIGG